MSRESDLDSIQRRRRNRLHRAGDKPSSERIGRGNRGINALNPLCNRFVEGPEDLEIGRV